MSSQRVSLPLVDTDSAIANGHGAPYHAPEDLLTLGNGKLGEGIWHFSLPALTTCPGRSRVCSSACYALTLYNRRRNVEARHQRNLAATQNLRVFRQRLLAEIRRRGVSAIRWHVAGDIHRVGYAKALLAIMQQTPRVEHFLYTRSWRVPRLRPWLARMAALPNVALWFSLDSTTGFPSSVPPGVRLCWMAVSADEEHRFASRIARCDLVFMDRPLRRDRRRRFGGVRVCPQERDSTVTCSTCRFCLPLTHTGP